jgi:2,3-bisphosphoglycerate-independent phosphoglycerate mutase
MTDLTEAEKKNIRLNERYDEKFLDLVDKILEENPVTTHHVQENKKNVNEYFQNRQSRLLKLQSLQQVNQVKAQLKK